MFPQLILHCIKNIHGERSLSGIYHILTGKRSSQTMQDARAYHLDNYFSIYKLLDRRVFHSVCLELERKELIVLKNDQYPLLTEKGIEVSRKSGSFFPFFQGMARHEMVQEFEKKLFLFVQTFINMTEPGRSFIPVIDDPHVQAWMKNMYRRKSREPDEMMALMYTELTMLLSDFDDLEATMITYRLTGKKIIGLTYDQLAKELYLDREDAYLYYQHGLYGLFAKLYEEPVSYPVLSLCIEGIKEPEMVTQSAKRTYEYLKQGYSIESITKKRRLKKSTIQDHIVEAALVIPQFSIDPFLSTEDQKVISSRAVSLNTKRLKTIYDDLNGEYTYFHIRLALAKEQKREGHDYA